MPRTCRNPHRERRNRHHSESYDHTSPDHSSPDQSPPDNSSANHASPSRSSPDHNCCRQNRRCGRLIETSSLPPPPPPLPHPHLPEDRNGGRSPVRRQRERRELRDRARREAIMEVTDRIEKPSTRSKVCRWANIAMGVIIALGLVFVFYVIATIIIDGSSPLDSLFGQKTPVDPNLKNNDSFSNESPGINLKSPDLNLKSHDINVKSPDNIPEVQVKSTTEPKEVITVSVSTLLTTISSVSIESGFPPSKEPTTENPTKLLKNKNSSNYEGRSYSDIHKLPEEETVDDYFYEDAEDNREAETESKGKTPVYPGDNYMEESKQDPLLNHDMHMDDNHQQSKGNIDFRAELRVNRKGLSSHHRPDLPLSALGRNKDVPSYGHYYPLERQATRRDGYIRANVQDDNNNPLYQNDKKERNWDYLNPPSRRNVYSDSDRYKLQTVRNRELTARPSRDDDSGFRLSDRSYGTRHADIRQIRRRDHEDESYKRPKIRISDDSRPFSKRYRVRSKQPYYSEAIKSFSLRDYEPDDWESYSYGRSLNTPASASSNVKLRKLTEMEKHQLLELVRTKRQQLSKNKESDSGHKRSSSNPREYKYPTSATSIQDIIDYMNYRDGKYDSKLSRVSASKEVKDIRFPPGYVIGDQDHVIGKNVFKPFNEFTIENQHYRPGEDSLSEIRYKNKTHFGISSTNDDESYGINIPISHNKEQSKDTNIYSEINDPRLPLEDAYPSRPWRPELEEMQYTVRPKLPNQNQVYPTVGDPYEASNSKTNTDPFSFILDIYPSEDFSTNAGRELRTHLTLSDEFKNEHDRMVGTSESRLDTSSSNPYKQEIILHLNLYSKPLRDHSSTSSYRQEGLSIDVPLTGRLSPLDIYRAVLAQKRLSPIASAQTGNSSELLPESLLEDFDGDDGTRLYFAIEEGLHGINSYLPENLKIVF